MVSTTGEHRDLPELRQRSDPLAKGFAVGTIAVDALREYLSREAWQIQEIQNAVKEADAGDFANAAEVKAVADKWRKNAG